MWIKPEENANQIYLIHEEASSASLKGRKDVAIMERKDANIRVIEYLFSQNVDEMKELMTVFIDKNLWGIMWLFHEVTCYGKSCFDEMILDVCDETIKELKTHENMWHINFMSLYCQYMKIGLSAHSLLSQMNTCEKLILNCIDMAKIKGWTPALCVLTGQICELSAAEKRHAIDFYNQALLYQEDSEILYKIGQIYEKVCGCNSKALEFYEKATKVDPYNFRARYEIAATKENQWEKAINEFLTVENLLETSEKPISTFEILYLHKVRSKILMICKKHVASQDMINMYLRKIQKHENQMDTLLRCMFGEQKFDKIRKK